MKILTSLFLVLILISNSEALSFRRLFSKRFGINAAGGTVTISGNYKIHKFTTNGIFTILGSGNVEVLVVGGGAGGSASKYSLGGAGGGGAGGLTYIQNYQVSQGQVISVVIGKGGSGGAAGTGNVATSGNPSSFGTISVIGGGAGASGSNLSARNGYGPGGGAGCNSYTTVGYGAAGVTGQLYNGGNTSSLSWAGGAGGGGAGGPGQINQPNHYGGAGGLGLTYSISGSPVVYSEGGRGGGGPACVPSPANTGKGGDAAYADSVTCAGGDGVVIVRYQYQ